MKGSGKSAVFGPAAIFLPTTGDEACSNREVTALRGHDERDPLAVACGVCGEALDIAATTGSPGDNSVEIAVASSRIADPCRGAPQRQWWLQVRSDHLSCGKASS